jgi:hypothetical protein
LDALLPTSDRDVIRRPGLKDAKNLPVALRLRQLDDLDPGAGSVLPD